MKKSILYFLMGVILASTAWFAIVSFAPRLYTGPAFGQTNLTKSEAIALLEKGKNIHAYYGKLPWRQRMIAGGGLTYNDIYLTGAGTGAFNFTGSNTFNNFRCDTPPHTIGFTGATVTTVRAFMVSGTAGNLITLTGIAAGFWGITLLGGGTVSSDYLAIDHCTGLPVATWYAGINSVDNLNNTNIAFIANPTPPRAILANIGAGFLDGSQQVSAR